MQKLMRGSFATKLLRTINCTFYTTADPKRDWPIVYPGPAHTVKLSTLQITVAEAYGPLLHYGYPAMKYGSVCVNGSGNRRCEDDPRLHQTGMTTNLMS